MTSLKSKTLNGLFWSFADSFGAYFLRFGFSVAVARALAPSDYGLMGMLFIFMAVGNILTEGGFGMALIQKKDATNTDFSTIFYFNLLISIAIYFTLFFSAHIIADFYNEQILVNVIRVSALTIVIGALSTIQTSMLSKELNFKRQTYISFASTIISGTTGVIIAYNGFAVWALVFQTLAGAFIRLVCLWLLSKWRPSLIFSWQSFLSLYKYGYKILLSGLADVFFTKLYFPLIGKYFSLTQLGYYTNASSFSEILVKQTSNSYGRVLFPAMALIQDDKEKLNRSYSAIFRLLSFVMFPVSIIAIVSSHSFVAFFLTNKWLPAVPYMQLFLVEGFFFALYLFNMNTFYAMGLSSLALKLEIFKKSLLLISLFVSFQFGIKALIIGQLTSSFITFLFSIYSVQKKIDFAKKLLLIELIKLSVITFFVFLMDYFVLSKNIQGSGWLLISKAFSLPIVYLMFAYIFKINALNDICSIFEKMIPGKIKTIINNRLAS